MNIPPDAVQPPLDQSNSQEQAMQQPVPIEIKWNIPTWMLRDPGPEVDMPDDELTGKRKECVPCFFRKLETIKDFYAWRLPGLSKSGKTYTSLGIAHTLAGESGKVAVIDTENASASKYAEQFPSFDVCELESFHPDGYVSAIKEAERLGYDVLIIDSLTHAWNGPGGLLETKHLIAKSGRLA